MYINIYTYAATSVAVKQQQLRFYYISHDAAERV